MLDPRKNNIPAATDIMHRFEEYRDLYAILDLDEHCQGGVRMVGQIHVMRKWEKNRTEYKYVEAALWLALSGSFKSKTGLFNDKEWDISIKDAIRMSEQGSQNRCVKYLLDKHMNEFLNSGRWSGNHPDDYDLSEESGWTQWLESGGLVVIKQTL